MTGADARPAWLVLDAARTHRFTGEVVFRTDPVVRVSFDRGEIYVAERTSDASLAHRLIDAGVLTANQVDRGSVRVGGVRHLGRLFDRVPGLDPHVLLAAVDLLTEECISWLAPRPVTEVAWVPYRRHPSGVFQWRRYDDRSVVELTDPMLSPLAALRRDPVEVPVERRVDLSAQTADTVTGEVLIEWEEPTWLDRAAVADRPVRASDGDTADTVDTVEALDDELDPFDEWAVDVAATTPGRRRRTDPDPIDRFELVWPSGEVDDQLGMIDELSGVVESDESVGAAGGPSPKESSEPTRPATTIRRATLPGSESTAVEGASSDDIDAADVVDLAETGSEVHPSVRRRMLPRRR